MSGQAQWTAYLDEVEAAVRAVAIAVSAGEPPSWPAVLAQPDSALPAALRVRAETTVKAMQAVFDVTKAARDGVACEIAQLARHGVVRDLTPAASLGGSFDARS